MTGLKLTSYFNDLKESIKGDNTVKIAAKECGTQIPFKESATLNQILYMNEKHNKRELPKNEDKKNLHEILEKDAMNLSEFEKEVELKLNDIDKDWKYISICKKRQLLEAYCHKHDVQLTDSVRKTILNNSKYVLYSQECKEIEDISIPL
jgi:hypothetical protein